MRLDDYKNDGYQFTGKSWASKSTDKLMDKHKNRTGCTGGSIAMIKGFLFQVYFCETCGRQL